MALQEQQAFRCETQCQEEEWVMMLFDLGSSVATGTVMVWSFKCRLEKFSSSIRETWSLRCL